MVIADGPGAVYLGAKKCRFNVWAPFINKLDVHIVEPEERVIPLEKTGRGYHQGVAEDMEPGYCYFYRLDGQKEFPDPASRYQPAGVHGPSQIVNSNFLWTDSKWSGINLQDYLIYELHVGAFTREGTFNSIIPYLDELVELGVTAIELMPVAQFPGERNWGYDSVYLYAVQNSYGGPEGLQRLVNACHLKKLAVILDVVYNHLGPEGNYLANFAPYFTERYRTPWGPALNFDGPYSDDVRRFFIENALYWITEFHVDALRLDAVHAILDHSPYTFLEELATSVHEQGNRLNRQVYLFPESADNDKRLVYPSNLGGYGLDAQWNDDFHHSIHVLLTGETNGYYKDYGKLQHLVKAISEGFVYSGEYSSFRKRRHGSSSQEIPAYRFVVCAQNHDQVGNRMMGERLSQLVSFEALKLAAGIVLLSPCIPLIFMGEEYGETNPFQYFVSHSDPHLIKAVRKGRKEEFAAFGWAGEPPDPQDKATFLNSKLNQELRDREQHNTLLRFYKELIHLRNDIHPLSTLSKDALEVVGFDTQNVLLLRRWTDDNEAVAIFNLSRVKGKVNVSLPQGRWRKILDSAEERWDGPGSQNPDSIASNDATVLTLSPSSFGLYMRAKEN